MQFIIENKWLIIISSETIAWIFTIFMAYSRYWLQSNFLFSVSTVVAVFTGWVVHITIPILEAIHLGGLKAVLQSKDALLFDGFIILLFILGFVFGKKYVKKIDDYFMNLANNRKNKSF